MDWTQFTEIAAEAAVVIAITGVIGASATEFIKQVVALFNTKLSAEWSAVISAVLSGAFAAFILYQQGVPLIMGIPAVLVALYAPQAAYGAVKRLQKEKKTPIGDEARFLRNFWQSEAGSGSLTQPLNNNDKGDE